MTNTEYLLRTVRESERMNGWQDSFSKIMENFSKEFSKSNSVPDKKAFEAEDIFEK